MRWDGKIGRLPKAVREEMNRRITAGETGRQIVRWLNGLPEVREMLEREFGGRPINEPNLSEWKRTGHREWRAQQMALEAMGRIAEEARDLTKLAEAGLADKLCAWLTGRYALAASEIQDGEGKVNLKLLRGIGRDVAELRRGDHAEARQKRKQAQLELERERLRKLTEKEKWEWAMQPAIRDRLCQGYLTPEQREERDRARIDEMRLRCFGVLAEPTGGREGMQGAKGTGGPQETEGAEG